MSNIYYCVLITNIRTSIHTDAEKKEDNYCFITLPWQTDICQGLKVKQWTAWLYELPEPGWSIRETSCHHMLLPLNPPSEMLHIFSRCQCNNSTSLGHVINTITTVKSITCSLSPVSGWESGAWTGFSHQQNTVIEILSQQPQQIEII